MAARKTKRNVVTKHDIFVQCAKIEKIPFWISFFGDCAVGNFPKGLSYKDGALHFKKLRRKAIQKVDIPQNPTLAVEIVKEFVRKEMQTMSDDELTKKRIEMGIALEKNVVPSDLQWKDIRAPTVKQQMLNLYAWKHVENDYISPEEASNFLSVVTVGLATGAITAKDITLKDGKITDIAGIGHNENGFHLVYVDFGETTTIPKQVARKHGQINSYQNWEKLDTQYNNYVKSGFSVK